MTRDAILEQIKKLEVEAGLKRGRGRPSNKSKDERVIDLKQKLESITKKKQELAELEIKIEQRLKEEEKQNDISGIKALLIQELLKDNMNYDYIRSLNSQLGIFPVTTVNPKVTNLRKK